MQVGYVPGRDCTTSMEKKVRIRFFINSTTLCLLERYRHIRRAPNLKETKSGHIEQLFLFNGGLTYKIGGGMPPPALCLKRQ